jgi:CheY-like chemotaxis protein
MRRDSDDVNELTASSTATRPVLIIEDNEIEREGLATFLRRGGLEAVTARSSVEAFDFLRANPAPAVILLDMLLPGQDGWSLMRDFRRHPQWSGIPVIITTALGIAGSEWGASLGAAACFRKPLDVDELLREVRRYA